MTELVWSGRVCVCVSVYVNARPGVHINVMRSGGDDYMYLHSTVCLSAAECVGVANDRFQLMGESPSL